MAKRHNPHKDKAQARFDSGSATPFIKGIGDVLPRVLPIPAAIAIPIDDAIASAVLSKSIAKVRLQRSHGFVSLEETQPPFEAVTAIKKNNARVSKAATSDPTAAKLHIEAKALYRDANNAYRAIRSRQFQYIRIYSGRRTTEEQAQLYENYIASLYGGSAAPKANKPGKSFHEYGLAIDIVRGSDEANLTSCLEEAGWVQSHDDEGWHFDAQGIASWSDIEAQIVTRVVPASEKFAQDLVVYYENRQHVEKNGPIHASERKRLDHESVVLRAKQTDLNATRVRLLQEQRNLKSELDAIQIDRRNIRALQQQYMSMVFNRCPNGKSYSECDHYDIKQQYDRERTQLLTRYQSAYRALSQREQAYASRANAYTTQQSQFKAEYDQYLSGLQKLNDDQAANDKLAKRIDRWRAEMNARASKRAVNLRNVVDAVGGI